MITCDFQMRGDMSLCEYLYSTIKDLVRGGSLKEGEKLPSKRSLASHLGVSVITVANAYARLISEGYMYKITISKVRSGRKNYVGYVRSL